MPAKKKASKPEQDAYSVYLFCAVKHSATGITGTACVHPGFVKSKRDRNPTKLEWLATLPGFTCCTVASARIWPLLNKKMKIGRRANGFWPGGLNEQSAYTEILHARQITISAAFPVDPYIVLWLHP